MFSKERTSIGCQVGGQTALILALLLGTTLAAWAAPEPPEAIAPADGAADVSLTPALQASPFTHADPEITHAASQWQVDVVDTFDDPMWDSGDAAAVAERVVPEDTLEHGTIYFWRVRYQDSEGAWSAWSEAASFSTMPDETVDEDQLYIERFSSDAAGWTATGQMEFTYGDGQGTDGAADGALVATFNHGSFPMPMDGSFVADASASAGMFAGDFSGYANSQIRFDFMAVDRRPSALKLVLNGPGTRQAVRTLPTQDLTPGVWHRYAVHLSMADSWDVSSTDEFNALLADVQSIEIRISSGAAGTLAYRLDNVELRRNAEAPASPRVPELLEPGENASEVGLTPRLKASAFSHPDAQAVHAGSEWQVARDAAFADKVWESGQAAADTAINVPEDTLEYETMYYWRVRYQDGDGRWSDWSDVFSFTTEQDPDATEFDPPDTPTLISPADGAVNQRLTPTLRASDFSHPNEDIGHAHSQWQVAADADFSQLVWDSGEQAAATQVTVPADHLGHETTYYWRMRHQGDEGPWSDWALPRSFTTVAGQGVPDNEWYPADGQVITDRRPLFTWPPIDGASWYRIHLQLDGQSYLEEWVEGAPEWQPLDYLPAGSYSWQVQGWSEAEGFGEWSEPETFVVEGRRPTYAVKLGPAGRQSGDTLSYRWEKAAGATHYRLFIQHHGSGIWSDKWYAMPETGVAEIALPDHPPGDYSWGVRPWGPDGFGMWFDLQYFSVVE